MYCTVQYSDGAGAGTDGGTETGEAGTGADTGAGSRRKKRNAEGPVSSHEFARSNSASSLLGLSIQLHVNKDEYRTDIGSYYTINEYFGFKVK